MNKEGARLVLKGIVTAHFTFAGLFSIKQVYYSHATASDRKRGVSIEEGGRELTTTARCYAFTEDAATLFLFTLITPGNSA